MQLHHAQQTWRVTTPLQTYMAPTIVNALGPWSHSVFEQKKPMLYRECFDNAVIQLVSTDQSTHAFPAISDGHMRFFMKPKLHCPGDLLLASPCNGQFIHAQDDPLLLNISGLAPAFDFLTQMDCVATPKLKKRWLGIKTSAADGLPIIGFDSVQEGLFWYNGFAGYGIKLAPAFAKIGYDLLSQADQLGNHKMITQLNPNRFARGSLGMRGEPPSHPSEPQETGL